MCGKQLINIWLAFRILGLEMNFDNFIGVTCMLCLPVVSACNLLNHFYI